MTMKPEKNNNNRDKYFTVTEKGFWPKWFSKFLFTLISVKVWGLIACTWISTSLLYCHRIDGMQWVTFNTTIWALIFGMKEIFRVMDRKDMNDEKIIREDNKAKEQIAKITASTVAVQSGFPVSKTSTYTSEGKEIVGTEPN